MTVFPVVRTLLSPWFSSAKSTNVMSSRAESHTSNVPFTISSDSEDDVSTTISETPPVRKYRPRASKKPAAQNEEELSMDLMCTTTSELSQMIEIRTSQSTIVVMEQPAVQLLVIENNTSHAPPDLSDVENHELSDREHHQVVDETKQKKFCNSQQQHSVAECDLVNRRHSHSNKSPSVSRQQADTDTSSITADQWTSYTDDSDSTTSEHTIPGEPRRSCSNLQPLKPPTLNHSQIFLFSPSLS